MRKAVLRVLFWILICIKMLLNSLVINDVKYVEFAHIFSEAAAEWLFLNEIPHHILFFAWTHTGSKLPCDSTPCFPGSRWRSSPSTRCSFTSRPWAVRWPRRRFLLLVGSYLFHHQLILVFSVLDIYWSSEVGALVLSRPQNVSSLRCASVVMDWFQCFFTDLCLDQVEKTVSLTCGSLFPATCFIRPLLKVPGSGCLCTF